MKIKGTEGLSLDDLNRELQEGGRFVLYQYCVSAIIMTFKRGSDIYFIRSKENPWKRGLSWSLLSLLLGWWGIPWGPIYTIRTVAVNIGGGKDVTSEVLAAANAHLARQGA
ncbi:MAG TPA: hypothetical protein VFS31_17845 [Chitinophagaceae bacterium]|jgi:hypothetical protein|nr:hypothetical protein [Chitinophagaceae bacterium]